MGYELVDSLPLHVVGALHTEDQDQGRVALRMRTDPVPAVHWTPYPSTQAPAARQRSFVIICQHPPHAAVAGHAPPALPRPALASIWLRLMPEDQTSFEWGTPTNL